MKQSREQPLGVFMVWADDHHQDVHIPNMGMLQKAAMVQSPIFELPLVNMASSMIPISRKHTSEQTPIHINNWWEDQLSKRNLPVEDPLHNWYMPDMAQW